MVNTNYNITQEMLDKLQSLKGKTKLNFYENISDYYIEMQNINFQTQKDSFSRNAVGISEIYYEVLLLMEILQTKPQVKNMNNNYYNLYYTVIRCRDESRDKDNQYENDESDYIIFIDFIFPNHNISRETILRLWREMRSWIKPFK